MLNESSVNIHSMSAFVFPLKFFVGLHKLSFQNSYKYFVFVSLNTRNLVEIVLEKVLNVCVCFRHPM